MNRREQRGIRKPKPYGARATKPARRCYELSGTAISFDDTGRLILVHGTLPVAVGEASLLLDHAWLLDPTDNTVFDTTDQRWYPAADYPGIERARYTQFEAARLMNSTGHFGRWD